MAPLEADRICFDDSASNFAFRAGQFVEKLLLDRGIEMARESRALIVRIETIRSCVDQSLLDQLRTHLHERDEQESRKVA